MAAGGVFARCARLRERLDDERGLVVALTNRASALSEGGHFGKAASILNRARVVAMRNGLTRHRNTAMLNLGVAYARRGQLRDARDVFRRVLKLGRADGDKGVCATAALNCSRAALDRWYLAAAESYLRQRATMVESAAQRPDIRAMSLRAEMAARARDYSALRTICKELRESGELVPEHAYYASVLPGRDALRDRDRGVRRDIRLRILCVKRGEAASFSSMRRIVRAARRYSMVRERLEWVCAFYRARPRCVGAELAFGLDVLSWFEFREGHDDLQIELRASLSRLLMAAGRGQEAWPLLEDALMRFRRLERKLSRAPQATPLLQYLYEAIERAMGAHGSRQGGSLSRALCAAAFDASLARRSRLRVTSRDGGAALSGLASALSTRTGDDLLSALLDLALDRTGAARAIIAVEVEGTRSVRMARSRGAPRNDTEISWAVVAQVLASGEPKIYNDALSAEELATHRSIAELRLRSLAAVPISLTPDQRAVLYVDHQGIAGLFGDDDLALLGLVAGIVGVSERAELVRRQAHIERDELRDAHKHMVRTERNRVAGEVAGGIAHDLKNMLTAVVARSQLLRLRAADAQIQHSAGAIEKAAVAGAGLLERLQQCSRDHSGQKAIPVHVEALIAEAVELLAHRLERGIEAKVLVESSAPVLAVPGELREVFLNLAVNACDAMPTGGELEFRIEAAGDRVQVEVSDTGNGIPEELRNRVFEPFFTTKGESGTGLGLVVVRNTLAHCGGSIELLPSEGTRFLITLPRYSE